MASMATARALIESMPSALNQVAGNSHASRKRKRISNEDSIAHPFIIEPHPSSATDELLSLTPLFSIPRQCLSVSFLDHRNPTSPNTPSRLFAANNPLLDHELEKSQGTNVLISKVTGYDTLCAIEKLESGIYALCKLANWATESRLWMYHDQNAKSILQPLPGQEKEINEDSEKSAWWSSSSIPKKDILSQLKSNKTHIRPKKLLRLNSSLSANTPASSRADFKAPRTQSNSAIVNDSWDTSNQIIEPSCPQELELSPEETFEKFRLQYLNTLYISKTPLAYFAKGPLARSRGAFAGGNDRDRHSDYVGFLRSGILSMKKLDQKYKESLPDTLKRIISASPKSDGSGIFQSRKRKSKKRRLRKNGLYPDEDEFISTWWQGRALSKSVNVSEASEESECKRLVLEVRLRETQLQIMIILEVMALEQSHPSSSEFNVGDTASLSSKTRPKKVEDLKALLDLLVDRLCIWQSLTADHDAPSGAANIIPKTTKESDVLRDFYSDVLVPFYASRLPSICKGIGRKLGALNPSPARPSLKKAASTSQVLPGQAVRRERPQHSRGPLQRVLTDEKPASHRRTSFLDRSNTAPSNRLLKREDGEPLQLSKIPERGGIQAPKRNDNREVDLEAVARQHETKIKKMNSLKEQKKELDDVINALRKPNRSLVSREFADSVVERASTNPSSRKSKNPHRIPPESGVQVMATPKAHRKKDAGGGAIKTARAQSPDVQEQEVPSSDTHIPSSTIRPGFSGDMRNTALMESVDEAKRSHSIQETPSRGPSKLSDPFGLRQSQFSTHAEGYQRLVPAIPRSTHDSSRPFKVPVHPAQTPQKKRRRLLQTEVYGTPVSRRPPGSQDNDIVTTPSKHPVGAYTPETPGNASANTGRRSNNEAVDMDELAVVPASSPPDPNESFSSSRHGIGKEKSIYESLGWDDDNDLDE